MSPEPFFARKLDDLAETLLQTLREWRLVRDLDIMVARFLAARLPQLDAHVAVMACIVSAQQMDGHLCLDLEAPLWPQFTANRHEQAALQRAFAAFDLPLDLSAWRTTLAASDAVSAVTADAEHATALDATEIRPLVLDAQRVYLARFFQQEVHVAQHIKTRMAMRSHPPEPFAERLARLFDTSDAPAGIRWQKVACALAMRSQFSIITGGPGTGKTTTVVRLLALAQGLALENGRPLRIKLAAPTGKAAARLTESIREQRASLPVDDTLRAHIPAAASTLHRLLGVRPHSRHFVHHAQHPVGADLVVVDEASMVDMDMLASLLDALAPHTRLILLGDENQLASVEAGAVLGELCQGTAADSTGYDAETVDYLHQFAGIDMPRTTPGHALQQHIAMLRTSYRFGDDSPIGQLARAVNHGDVAQAQHCLEQGGAAVTRHRLTGQRLDEHLPELLDTAGTGPSALLQHARAVPQTSDPHALDTWARDCLERLREQQLLSGLRTGDFGVTRLNDLITQYLSMRGLVPPHTIWYAGRPVMLTGNDYQLGLMNGDVGMTLAHPQEGLRVVFERPDNSLHWVAPGRLDSVETVYAMTVHKSQGSGFTHTWLILPDKPHPLLTRELIYTAITRSKQQFSLLQYGPDDVLAQAIKHPTHRASGLRQKIVHPKCRHPGHPHLSSPRTL